MAIKNSKKAIEKKFFMNQKTFDLHVLNYGRTILIRKAIPIQLLKFYKTRKTV